MREQENKADILTAIGMALAGVGFLIVGGVEGLSQASMGLSAGVVPMIFGAGFLGVAGMYLFNTVGDRLAG